MTVTSPSGADAYLGTLGYISGTSLDTNGLGEVRETYLRVKNQSLGQYWSWGTNNYTESSPDAAWFVVSTTETVLYSRWFSTGTAPGGPAGGVNLVTGSTYEMSSRVLDKAGNYNLVYSTRSITYDITKPTGAVTGLGGVSPAAFHRQISPVNGSGFDGLSGGAAGLALLNAGGAQVRILDKGIGKWWDYLAGNFSISGGDSAWFNANSGTSEGWSYTYLALPAKLDTELVTGSTYCVQYRGRDKSAPVNEGPSSDGNDALFTQPKDSVTFIADRLEPVSRVTFPRDGAHIKALVTVTGTAADANSGIAAMGQIGVSMREVSPGAGWWDGFSTGTFSASSEVFYPLSIDQAAIFAGGAWSFDSPALQHGYTYRVRVRVTDNAKPGGNVESAISSVTFVYDITAPAAAIVYPIGLSDLRGNIKAPSLVVSGTAFESYGIKSASVSVMQVGPPNFYYDPATSLFNAPSAGGPKWITAAILGLGPNYTWTVTAPALTDNKNYDLQVIADDLADNVLVPPTATTIRYDITPPASGAISPADGSFIKQLAAITGTALDPNSNPSTVAGTQIKIKRSDDQYWNGSTWGAENWLAGVAGSPAWSKTAQLPPSDNLTGLENGMLYTVQTRSYDIAGNTQTPAGILTGNSFRFDISSPTAFISQPLNGSRKISLPLVSGTASDVVPGAFNVDFPKVRLYDIALNRFWLDGTGWVDDEFGGFPEIWNVALDSSSAGGSFNWRWTPPPLTDQQRDNELRTDVKVMDRAGNYSITSSTFSFDNIPPLSRIKYPPANGALYSSMTAITGTTSDVTSGVSNVKILIWYLSGPSTYYWHTLAPHWSIDENWVAIPGAFALKGATGSPWTYSPLDFYTPGEDFAWKEGTHDGGNGKTFYIVTKARDGTTNDETALSTRTFVFDNVPPVSAPWQPGIDTAYKGLPTVYGTSTDAVTTVQDAKICILSENETAGPRYFNGSNFVNMAETWLPIMNLFQSSWTYTFGLSPFTTGQHYVVKSSATDSIGNVQNIVGRSRFLFDQLEPQSVVDSPINTMVEEDAKSLLGSSLDAGFTSGIDGSGSGVYPEAAKPWHAGKVEVMVFRDADPYIASNGPLNTSDADSSGYFWNGSTWTASAGGEIWVPAQFYDTLGNWQYTGLVCDGPGALPGDDERAAHTCWVRGDSYAAWVRVTDNAGNLQTIVSLGPKFYIAAKAASFLVTVAANPMTAGSDINLTVEARDGANGAGSTARAYQGTVNFSVDGVPGGPEVMDNDDTMDNYNGLPKRYTFLPGDYGVKTFQMRLRKAAPRTLRVADLDNVSIYGSRNVTVNPTAADRVQVIADFDTAGQLPAPGRTEAVVEGSTGTPRSKPAGSSVPFLLQVTDLYWNLVVSSAASVYVTDTDPNNGNISADGYVNFVGSTTLYRTFVSASPSGWGVTAAEQGISNPRNPSSNVPIMPQAATRLLALFPGESRVQGKWDVQPLGKTGTISSLLAGATFQTRVYGVDEYYNTDTTAGFKVYASIPTDPYDINPSSNTLVSGATAFIFTPVVAATHTIKAESSALAGAASVYYTPDPVTVWWNRPVKLHLIAPGQGLLPGLPTYGANPSPGGKSGSPGALTAGATAEMAVYLVDEYYNVVKGTTPFMAVSSNTPNIQIAFLNDANIQGRGMHPDPYQRSLLAGTTTFSVIPVTRNLSPGLSVQVTGFGGIGAQFSTDTVSGIVVNPAPARKLLLLVPTEAVAEGASGGKTGTAGPLTAGATYTITVRSMDIYGNLANDGRSVKLKSNDIYAVHPPAQLLDGGIADFIMGFVPSAATSNLVIDAIDFDSIEPKLSTSTDSGIVVNPGTASRLIVLLPTQYLVPGKVVAPFGVEGNISTQTAGVGFNSLVYAADTRYNRVTAGVPDKTLHVTTNDPFAADLGNFSMTAGSATLNNVILRTGGPRALTVNDPGGLGTTISGGFLLVPFTPTKLRAMIPGESRVAGSTTTGRSGADDGERQAGFPFTVTVDITDSFWNLTPGASQQVSLVADDLSATVVPPSQVITGSATFTVTPRRAGNTVLTAAMGSPAVPGGPTLAPDTATTILVAPGIPTRLLLVLPGESFSQGSATGRSGQAAAWKAGTDLGVRVYVVDDYFNKVPGRPADVKVNTPTDAYVPAVSTASLNTTLGYTDLILFSMRRAATHYLTVSDFLSSGLAVDLPSSTFTVRAADPMGLQLLLPGETAVPGSGNYPSGGKTVGASSQTAGTGFFATVNLVDRYMNVSQDLSVGPTVYLVTSDIYDIDSDSVPLNYGTNQVPLNLVTKVNSASARAYPVNIADNYVCSGNFGGVCLADDAAARVSFKVYASTAVRLEVVLPGQTLVEGKCAVSPPCRNASLAWPGRSGPPAQHTIGLGPLFAGIFLTDMFFNKATEASAADKDTNPIAVMPEVGVTMPGDTKTAPPAVQTLSNGSAVFSLDARTSISSYTVLAATSAVSPAGTGLYQSGISTLTVNPGPAASMAYVVASTNVVAGTPFSALLYVKDAYGNICSTGPNVYRGTATFVVTDQAKNIQDPVLIALTTSYYASDYGVKNLVNWFKLHKAGPDAIGARDSLNSAISVTPLLSLYVSHGPPTIYRVTPNLDEEVPAGSLISRAVREITGQLADSFDNNIPQAGLPAYVMMGEVYGSTGSINYKSGVTWFSVGTSTLVYTDALGQVGVSTPLGYQVSSKSGDWARVWIGTTTVPLSRAAYDTYAAARQNLSGQLATTGGTPSKLVYVSSQPAAWVGIQEVLENGNGAFFTVERRDDFDNVTRQEETGVYLGIPSAQVAVHTGLGRTMGTVGNVVGDYGFRDTENSEFITALIIPINQTQASFRYHDRTASYSGVSPAANDFEDGRPGYWQLEARSGAMQPAIHQLRVNPSGITQVAFGNAPRSMTAGKLKDRFGIVQVFRPELRDTFANPSVATAAVRVALSTHTRQASLINDSFSFSISSAFSGAFPPVFASTISFLDIPLDAYSATFYYLDTAASSVYASSAAPIKPILGLSVPEMVNWAASTQSVTIVPDLTYRVNVSSAAGQSLTAGATSQNFMLSIEDHYGNPTPVAGGQEDAADAGIAFTLDSTSLGGTKFSAPDPGYFMSKPGSARMLLGQASTSFYLIDTLVSAPTHQLTVNTVLSKGWLPAISSYTVTPAPPDHVVFHTTPRRLVAGTTVQYYLGLATATVVSVALKDRYENNTTTNSPVTVRFSAVRNTTYGGIDPSVPVLSSNPSWKLLKTNPLDLDIPVGYSYANIYVWDTIVGSTTITADPSIPADSLTLPSISQDQYITPSSASYFTLHHTYTLGSPLRVRAPGYLTLRARDPYGNAATGDSINGKYYVGKIKMATNSQGSADLWAYPQNTTDYTFTTADRGEHQLLVQDTLVENLKVTVTDYNLPLIFGYTNDSGRGVPVYSNADVVLSGLVITPRDFAPEDPLPADKRAIGITKRSIYQGDGVIADIPSPVPMLRLAMRTAPAGAPPAFLKSVQIKSSGTLTFSDIIEVGMYADNPAPGKGSLGTFEGETELGGSPVDIFMSSGTYDPAMMGWNFEDLIAKVSTAAIVSNTSRNFFFTVRMSTVAATPRSFALVMDNPDFIVLDSTFVGVAYNNFPIVTATSPVSNQPATIKIGGSDIGAWWKPANSASGRYNYVQQGTERAAFLAIQAWTENFIGTIRSFRIIKTGTGAGSDLKSVRLFLDDGSGVFDQAIDKEVTDPANPPTFDPADPGTFVLPLYNPGVDGTVSIATRTYFVVYEFTADAVPSPFYDPPRPETLITHGARLENSAVSLLDGVVGAFSPIVSSTVPLYATADMVYLQDVNKAAPNDFSKPSFVTQNDVNKAVARLTLEIKDSAGSAVWRGLKLDRWVTGSENGNTAAWNKVTDVKRISLWYDSTRDGLLQSTSAVKDIEVVLIGAQTRTFPYDTLRLPLKSTDTVIRVTDIQKFFPSDSPFPRTPGRLIMNDGQSDPSLKEVIYYSTVDVVANTFGGLTRFAEGTTNSVVWGSGTVISGQAVLPLIGEAGGTEGQVLYTEPKDYFVTYDINPLANVSAAAYLGMAIRSTDYFSIDYPKFMSPAIIGVATPGKTLSLIGRVAEYADAVTVRATDTVTGGTLQQKAVDQTIMNFTIETSVADAIWRWVLVYATGTVVKEGTATGDVSAVKVWYDKDNNGFLGSADPLIGTGVFGNTIFGPLAARVDISTQRVVTSAEADSLQLSRRYFVTYDIKASAMPNDSLGNPRFLGAYLKPESFPTGSPGAEDPSKNSISLPNFFSQATSNLSFTSRLRELISAPSTVTVRTEPIFSPGGGASALSTRLAQDIAGGLPGGTTDSAWLVVSTAGLPSSGYIIVDNEIVRYAGTAFGALTTVIRGSFNTPVVAHSSGSVVGGMVSQGLDNYPYMKMTMATSGYGVRWRGFKLSRKQPAGINGYDSDVGTIRVWKDNGNGLFDRDPVSGRNTSDIVVGYGSFGVNDPVGKATILVADPALNKQNYVVVSATPTVIFVSMDIDKASKFSHAQLNPQNDVLGVEVVSEANFIFGPDNSGHDAQFLTPAAGPVSVLMPTLNNISLTPEDISPVSTTQNDKNVGLLSMRMRVDKTSALLEAVRLNRRGSANDSDIDLIKVWRDSNDNCLLDSVDTATNTAGLYPNLMTYGNEAYSSGTLNVVLKTPIVVTTNTSCAFITYDMSQFALVGSSAALNINSIADFTVGIPNTLSLSTSPINTMPIIVLEIPSNVTLGATDMAAELVQVGGVGQAQAGVPMARFNLATEAGNARWSAIKLQRTGASNDPNAPFARNTDVKFISIVQDSNQNDLLDVNDVNVSEARTTLAVLFASTDTVPFQLVVESTAGFPSAGRLYISGAELASYSGTGISASGKPYLTVTSRGEKLGDLMTPHISHAALASVRKVDVFDQESTLNTQLTVFLSQVQTLSPLPQTYFGVFDIGEMATKANKVGLMIRDKSWLTVNVPHDISPSIYIGVTKVLPKGTYIDVFPFSSSLVPIRAITLRVTGTDVSPRSVEKKTRNAPMMSFSMATQSDYVAIGQVNITQGGTISSSTLNYGDGDIASVSLWKDDGDGAFSPITDYRLGYSVNSATNPFKNGIQVNLMSGNLPYLVVSTSPVVMHVTCDISSATDLSGADTLGHLASLSLKYFVDLRGLGGLPLAAGQYAGDNYPMGSNQVLIAPAIIPLTPVFTPITLASNGYPAYALTDSSGNVVQGAGNMPLANTGSPPWIRNNPPAGCKAGEPLIDINGDGIPDNFDFYGTGKCTNISLNNSGLPSFDIDGDNLLDFESNMDYVPDRIMDDGAGKPLYFLGDTVKNARLLLAVSDLGSVPSVWSAKTTELPAMWNPASGLVVSYELSLGNSFANPTDIKNAWQPTGASLAGRVTNVALSPGHFTRLLTRIDVNTSSFTVQSSAGFAAEGIVYVGNEIMLVNKLDATSFKIVERGIQGSFRGPHTAWGETVSDRGYIMSVRGIMADGSYVPSENGAPIMIYRIDTTYPTTPGAPEPQVAKGQASGQAYTLKWTAAEDPESNLMSYEVQEREGTSPVWKTVAAIPGFKTGGAINNIYTIGDTSLPGETPRPLGTYYTYRVRSWNFAGLHSEWSDVSTPAGTTIGTELLSKVSSYPNPVDLRKGGVEGRVDITYTLNDNAEVTMTIYDLLGYVVREFKFSSGSEGGKLGPNHVLWNGQNGLGGIVGKGGYIVRVKASSPKGSKVIMRKVGVIH
ncbi:MAG: fibronectin type III domain-containing protein [Elusimicrobiota bacterium]|nr:fibronectin type III domain-containing protein [Elusimicrobiota bacterium]